MNREEEIKKQVQEQFGKHAKAYVTSVTHAKGEDLPLLVEWLKPQADWRVLDVATGGGHVAKTLAPHCRQVVATDLTVLMLEAAREAHLEEKLENILHVQADAEKLPFLSETFDVVCCRIAAHHFPNPAAFIREISRVLRPNGQFVLIDNVVPDESGEFASIGDFINQFEALRDPSHVRCLSPGEWKVLMEREALEVQQERLRKKRFQFLPWVKRTAQSQEQQEAVEQMLLQADDHIRSYMGVSIADGRVQEHEIDEWMVLCKKR
ncbi:class I SAM-dependent methyltransferase [Brevibacillus ruminantium]|uniref:Class I SAM-dependent methyltransferase n=1 Tax=Brevibacillus ruminantium TaxID=2950604 RepID=A0ABY4WG45_9BACL|nr:class I SAM-dependent methyltransferase [Brevibacillus ruminantium]USG63626.1 class I SAM-dependent methyltransferase [Brevibacillus ruminantium]